MPTEVPIHRVRGLSSRWARLPGFGGIEARSFGALARAGSRLLRQRHFDAVYFSTTAFGCFALGPLWKRRHGVPFLLDYQDPWVNDYYHRHPLITPPGGRFKYAVSHWLNRLQEPRVLRQAAGYTAVSSAYPAQLQVRYPFAAAIPSLVLPFPGSAADFHHLESIPASQLPFDPHDGFIHWVSIGRGGADLHPALEGLFKAIALHAPAELRQRLRLHFFGTSYAPAGRGIPTIAPLAVRYGLGEIVEERTDRLPLSLSLAALNAADALLVIGSNDPGYTASKLYPYLLARRPLLAVVHARSSIAEVLRRCGGGELVTFAEQGEARVDHPLPASLAQQIAATWLLDHQHAQLRPLDLVAFEPHTAAAQAAALMSFLHICLAAPPSPLHA